MGPTGGDLKLFAEWEDKGMEMRGITGRKRRTGGKAAGRIERCESYNRRRSHARRHVLTNCCNSRH
jgi:hypothetical protein